MRSTWPTFPAAHNPRSVHITRSAHNARSAHTQSALYPRLSWSSPPPTDPIRSVDGGGSVGARTRILARPSPSGSRKGSMVLHHTALENARKPSWATPCGNQGTQGARTFPDLARQGQQRALHHRGRNLGARPVHPIITIIKWTRTSWLSTKNSLCLAR